MSKKQVHDEREILEGREYIKIQPFTFSNFIKINGCDDLDSIYIDFARKFGTSMDVSFKSLIKFLEEEIETDMEEAAKWLLKNKFVIEAKEEVYELGTKFFDGKREVMVINIDGEELSLLDLTTFKCPYGCSDTRRSNAISKSELWELLEFETEEFTKFIKSAH